MPRGGAVALGSLIRLATPFGLNERLVRTATARLAQEGWVKARRVGKLSEYELSNDGRERFAEATKRIYGEPGAHWSGRWTLMCCRPCLLRSGSGCERNSSGMASVNYATVCLPIPKCRPRDSICNFAAAICRPAR